MKGNITADTKDIQRIIKTGIDNYMQQIGQSRRNRCIFLDTCNLSRQL